MAKADRFVYRIERVCSKLKRRQKKGTGEKQPHKRSMTARGGLLDKKTILQKWLDRPTDQLPS